MANSNKSGLFIIADCFPLLEELELSFPRFFGKIYFMFSHDDQCLALPKLRKINLSGTKITHKTVNHLCKNCHLLEEVIIT